MAFAAGWIRIVASCAFDRGTEFRRPAIAGIQVEVPKLLDELRRQLLDAAEVDEFGAIVERTIAVYAKDFESGFVAESPDKLRRLPRYYAALGGAEPFPGVSCNAPWVSVVLEANGSVRPCFFHGSIGNIRQASLGTIVSRNLRAFRESFDVGANPVCVRCVCSLKTSWRSAPWAS
jgi:MoaA/NifB/PqqE/SkfB family radical SAM enzyme